MPTFLIPADNLPALKKKIDQINRKATKLATPPVILTKTGKTEKVLMPQDRARGMRYSYKAVEVVVEGSAPVVEGWEFVAIIRHKLTENAFITIPGSSYADLSEYQFAPKNCDHCKKQRVRNASYIVKNTTTNELMQVGSSCLSDFTGWNDPQQAAKAAENIWKLFHDHIPAFRVVPRTTREFSLEEWMAFVAQQVRLHGWKPRKDAMMGEATADRAKVAIINYYNDAPTDIPTDPDWLMAKAMITWARGLAHEEMQSSDFKDSLMAAFAPDYITEDYMGTTAAVFPALDRVEREKLKAAIQASQNFVGTKGEKIDRVVTVERIGGGDFGYGWTTIYNFTDGVNKYVWFSSKDMGLAERNMVRVIGTVKDHKVDNYTGDKQTVLTRCKVEVI